MKKQDKRLRSSFDEKIKKQKGEKLRMLRLEEERRTFATHAEKPFVWHDSSFWRVHGLRIKVPKGHTLVFFVVLKKPLPKKIINEKLEQAFGGMV